MLRLLFLILLNFGAVALAHENLPVTLLVEEAASGPQQVELVLPPSLAAASPQLDLPGFCRPVPGETERARYRFRCDGKLAGQRLGLQLSGEPVPVPTLVRLVFADGEVRISTSRPGTKLVTIPSRQSSASTFRDYGFIGLEHIAGGLDHLLFLACLLLLARSPRTIVLAVTGFTIGHAISMIGTALGFWGLPGPPVEAAVALSIMFLAAEYLRPGPTFTKKRPVAVSLPFGLLHGFAFGAALREIGLPQTEVPLALLSFNLGIEAGQLVFVLVWLASISAGTRLSHRFRIGPLLSLRSGQMTASVAGGVAGLWFWSRLAMIVA